MSSPSEIRQSVEQTLRRFFKSWQFRALAGIISGLWVANVRFMYTIAQDQSDMKREMGELRGIAESVVRTQESNGTRIERLENVTLFRMSVLRPDPKSTPKPVRKPKAR